MTDRAPTNPPERRAWSEPGRTTLEIATGRWRSTRPRWVEAPAPCAAACPAGEPIARWIDRARHGDYAGAWSLIREENPFPAVTGRVCAHACETACNRAQWDGALAINALERFVGDWGVRHGTVTVPSSERAERAAIVGSGPAGLTCAYHLARRGYRVTVFEALPQLGGMLRYGIPAYRLPRAVLDREIELILSLGIDVETGRRVSAWEGLAAWDAVFIAVGATVPLELDVPGRDARGIRHGLDVLHDVNTGGAPELGSQVTVVGGGSTAMDVARVARRLGVTAVTVLALETRAEMPALSEEVTQAQAEGVKILNGIGLRSYRVANGAVTGVTVSPARLERGAHGVIRAAFTEDARRTLDADSVILAIGQQVDGARLPRGLRVRDGIADSRGAAGGLLLFAGGDMASRERTVTHAIGSGTRAARAIDALLSGSRALRERPASAVPFPRINTYAFTRARRLTRWERLPDARVGSFIEVVGGVFERAARDEASRCFSCGHCTGCDVCLTVCPDIAIARANGGYRVANEHCKGCGLCARECPRGALAMSDEP